MGSQQEVNRIAFLIDGAVQVFPLAFDLDVGLIDAPAPAHCTLAFAKRFSKNGTSLMTQRCTLE
jgi:hypothetical protein